MRLAWRLAAPARVSLELDKPDAVPSAVRSSSALEFAGAARSARQGVAQPVAGPVAALASSKPPALYSAGLWALQAAKRQPQASKLPV
jgi:hypothetical protein